MLNKISGIGFRTQIIAVVVMMQCAGFRSAAQQIADLNFKPVIRVVAYPPGKGSTILIDEAHHNFHTIDGRFGAFARVLSSDGYVVKPNAHVITQASLIETKILVIANALHESNLERWSLPTPSAFTASEIKIIHDWVSDGGSLFLIADHMPFPGAAGDLAKAFDFTFYNGFASDTTSRIKRELDIFKKSNGSLKDLPASRSNLPKVPIDHIATFTGQGFEIPKHATSLLTFDGRYELLLPDTAWIFSRRTKRIPIKGFSQGAVAVYGKGRVAVFGEAAMFTAQLKGKEQLPFGLNSPDAKENVAFLLNLIHWLDTRQ